VHSDLIERQVFSHEIIWKSFFASCSLFTGSDRRRWSLQAKDEQCEDADWWVGRREGAMDRSQSTISTGWR